jgi:hypothetical protein
MQLPGASANAAEILACLPERISDVIHRHALERPERPALVDVAATWNCGVLAGLSRVLLHECATRVSDPATA